MVSNINDDKGRTNPKSTNHKKTLQSADTDKLLTASIAALPEEITPERDLWAGIERAISTKKQLPDTSMQVSSTASSQHSNVHKVTFTPMAWAASIVLAVLISWGTLAPLIQNSSVEQVAQQPTIHDDLVNFMEQNFTKQKQTMLVSFGQPSLATLPVEMQSELTKLADARKTISKALLADKNNVDLLNLLDFTQQQELKLLEQLYRQYQVI